MKVFVVTATSNQFGYDETWMIKMFDRKEKAIEYIEKNFNVIPEYDHWRLNDDVTFDQRFYIEEWEVE